MDDKVQEYVVALAGGLAHEIKTPLSTITMNIQLLTEDLERTAAGERTPREERILKKLRLLEKEASRLELTLNGFLHFVGTRSPEKKPGSINLLISEILDFVSGEAETLGVALRRELDYRIPLFHFAFEPIRQALFNIIKNGLEAMSAGGELHVETFQERSDVVVSITDTGPSIPPRDRKRIFDPYYSTKPDGTGLGLAVAKRAIREHGGTIEVGQGHGGGAAFLIRLPLGDDPVSKSSGRFKAV